MSIDAERLACALTALVNAGDALDKIPSRIESAMNLVESNARAAAVLGAADEPLHPDHAYPPETACRFIGVKQTSFRKISAVLLPRVRSGRVLGIDLMAYRGDITRDEAAAYKAAKRALVTGVSA
ncbi:MAG TPA: hypothetical protein VGB53_16975 [Rubricoccaceae bacterium]|jgi:hypothetical protein